jgi:hypothetical protein
MEFNTDLAETNHQLKRIADLLEGWIYPPLRVEPPRGEVIVHTVDVRGRWEAEREAARMRGQDDEVRGVAPRR